MFWLGRQTINKGLKERDECSAENNSDESTLRAGWAWQHPLRRRRLHGGDAAACRAGEKEVSAEILRHERAEQAQDQKGGSGGLGERLLIPAQHPLSPRNCSSAPPSDVTPSSGQSIALTLQVAPIQPSRLCPQVSAASWPLELLWTLTCFCPTPPMTWPWPWPAPSSS